MNSFIVLQPGPLTTFQDIGRLGHMAQGLTEGGPLDVRSFAIANQLVSNEINCCALEITLGGLSLQCTRHCSIAVTGAYCPVYINGKAQSLWKTLHLRPNDQLNIGYAALGTRAYLAVNGGFDAPLWLNSASTVLREKTGTALQKGQALKSHSSGCTTDKTLPYLQQPAFRKYAELRYVKGYQASQFSEQAQKAFLAEQYILSKYIDRMGFRLIGPDIHSGIQEIYSEGIARGAIQITGSGQPIIMMKDRQTIGGYPKMGSVISPDLDKLGQMNQGMNISFTPVTAEQAVKIYREYWQSLLTLI